jgi:hypothetical protein
VIHSISLASPYIRTTNARNTSRYRIRIMLLFLFPG